MNGFGEIMHIGARPANGTRNITLDTRSGLITNGRF